MSHDHEHPDSPENPFAGQGAVALDIGGDIGALIVEMPPDMVGQEIEVQPEGAPLPSPPAHEHEHGHGHGHHHAHDESGTRFRPHVAVVRRTTAAGTRVPSLVFPELTEGRYELLHKGTDDVRMVAEVTGGQVTMLRWPGL